MEAAIEAKSLSRSYKNVSVLKDVSFSVQKGTVFALLGSNGAGKTTTINILTTLIKADGGTAAVAGYDIAARPHKVRDEISLTGQFAAVDNRLTGRENLLLIGDLRHVADSAKTAADLLRRFGLEEAADRAVSTFSGGMRRRLDIAMSLIGSPAVIFLDEPTTGFDPEARNEMWRTIHKLAEGGTTVFLTTQYLEEADELADDIAVLHQGRIVASGTAGELKKLVPGGLIELTFHDEKTRDAAAKVLGRSYAHAEGEGATLTISTDGTVAQVLFTLSTTWLAIFFGLLAKTTEGAGAFSYVLLLLIFISPAFVPTNSMTPLLRGFAENQPMTPVVETMRSLLVNGTAGPKVWTAIAWILGLLVVSYLLSVAVYKRKAIVVNSA